MRRVATPAEEALWRELRGRKLAGLKFRRQHPVGRFVLDFYCPEARLAIELDGPVHDDQGERDEARTAHLQAAGLRVIRFRNEEILHGLQDGLERIQEVARSVPPLPELGEGARG